MGGWRTERAGLARAFNTLLEGGRRVGNRRFDSVTLMLVLLLLLKASGKGSLSVCPSVSLSLYTSLCV